MSDITSTAIQSAPFEDEHAVAQAPPAQSEDAPVVKPTSLVGNANIDNSTEEEQEQADETKEKAPISDEVESEEEPANNEEKEDGRDGGDGDDLNSSPSPAEQTKEEKEHREENAEESSMTEDKPATAENYSTSKKEDEDVVMGVTHEGESKPCPPSLSHFFFCCNKC